MEETTENRAATCSPSNTIERLPAAHGATRPSAPGCFTGLCREAPSRSGTRVGPARNGWSYGPSAAVDGGNRTKMRPLISSALAMSLMQLERSACDHCADQITASPVARRRRLRCADAWSVYRTRPSMDTRAVPDAVSPPRPEFLRRPPSNLLGQPTGVMSSSLYLMRCWRTRVSKSTRIIGRRDRVYLVEMVRRGPGSTLSAEQPRTRSRLDTLARVDRASHSRNFPRSAPALKPSYFHDVRRVAAGVPPIRAAGRTPRGDRRSTVSRAN